MEPQPAAGTVSGVGSGVTSGVVERIYDRYIDARISTEAQAQGKWEGLETVLQQVEMVFAEASGVGLNSALSEFWNAWQDLSNAPEGYTERVVLLEKSRYLCDVVNQMAGALAAIRDELNGNIAGGIDQINAKTGQIAELNQAIGDGQARGQDVNGLLDRRDALVRELSVLADINSFTDDNGHVNILLKNGRPLVDGVSARNLSVTTDGDVLWHDGTGTTVGVTTAITGGQLAGWIEARDTVIPGYMESLDTLALTLADEINQIHRSGFGIPENSGDAPPTGLDFFTGTGAGDLTLNSLITASTIAAAATADGVPGDNSNALAISGLQNRLTHDSIAVDGNLENIGSTTIDGYYAALVAKVGADVQNAQSQSGFQAAVVDNLENYRESVSGVNLDEEMVNLVKYQQAYEASARLIRAVDELIDTVINLV